MINMERNGNGIGIGGINAPLDKQLPAAPKKVALRDVQNENAGSVHKQPQTLLPGIEKSSGDAIKVCGTKRLTPERPPVSQNLSSSAHNDTNENVMNARRRLDLEFGRGRPNFSDYMTSKTLGQTRLEIPEKTNQMKDDKTHHIPKVISKNSTPILAFSSTVPSVPNSFGSKLVSSTETAKVPREIPSAVDPLIYSDNIRTERYIQLQKFLKQCDEANHKENIQSLLHLSPSELSKHAVKLERRSMELTIQEATEIKRMMALNITPNPSLSNKLLHPAQLHSVNRN